MLPPLPLSPLPGSGNARSRQPAPWAVSQLARPLCHGCAKKLSSERAGLLCVPLLLHLPRLAVCPRLVRRRVLQFVTGHPLRGSGLVRFPNTFVACLGNWVVGWLSVCITQPDSRWQRKHPTHSLRVPIWAFGGWLTVGWLRFDVMDGWIADCVHCYGLQTCTALHFTALHDSHQCKSPETESQPVTR